MDSLRQLSFCFEHEFREWNDSGVKNERQNPFNGSAMNSPPTPPYCGSVAATLDLLRSQTRCGSSKKSFSRFCSFYSLHSLDSCPKSDESICKHFTPCLKRFSVGFWTLLCRFCERFWTPRCRVMRITLCRVLCKVRVGFSTKTLHSTTSL